MGVLKSDILATKLHQPALPTKWIQRSHLSQRLNEGLELERRLTLVSAPAGFGKSTCTSAWLDNLQGWKVSWLSLDAADDDPTRFLVHFIAALQRLDAGIGLEIMGILRSGQLPPSEVISTALINEILELHERTLLVLDDFHLIQDRFILQFIEQLIANLPQRMHLVLITREDPPLPLARLRANNQMTEIRAVDLRFNTEDIYRFMQETTSQHLSQADIAALEAKTEGWIAGLQLAGLSMRDKEDPSLFITGLSGSHRFILSYLTEQVLSQQTADMQEFLLQTAVLDKLSPGLCRAVTGRKDSPTLLEQAFRANLFLVPLDDRGEWYRYHHLFAELLRDLQDKLGEIRPAELHRRASRWYTQEGMVSDAIQHALQGQDYPQAVALLEDHALEMIMQGYAKSVNGWLQAMPDEWEAQSPRTNLAFAWSHLLRGAYAQASPYLERLEGSFSNPGLSPEEGFSLKAEWMVMRSLLLNLRGEIKASLELAAQAQEIVPESDNRVRGLVSFGLASAYESLGDQEKMLDAYQEAIQHARLAETPIVEMLSVSALSRMAFEQGKLQLAFEIAFPVSERVEISGSPVPISMVVHGILGEICYQWHDTERARHYILRALHLSTLGGSSSGITNCRVLLSRLSLLEGDIKAAADEIQKAVDQMHADTPDYVRQEAVYQQVRVYLARGLPAPAGMALQAEGFTFQERFSYPELPPGDDIRHSTGLLYCSSLYLLLYMARKDGDVQALRAGIKLADELVARALKSQTMIVGLEALLLRAQMHALLGDHAASQEDYTRALVLGEPERIMGVFVDTGQAAAEALADLLEKEALGTIQTGYIQSILEAYPGWQTGGSIEPKEAHSEHPADIPMSPMIEPLTERELDVLRLMAEGLKYKEIAAQLFISLNTVRYHVKTIYGKLNVNNRTLAVETARQHHIL